MTIVALPPPYPVNPQVHIESGRADALDPGTFQPVVSNAFAHARYMAAVLGGTDEALDDSQVEAAFAKAAIDPKLCQPELFAGTRRPDGSWLLQGLKAWLNVCAAQKDDAPSSLVQFQERFGRFDAEALLKSGEWSAELHPRSRAKLVGRRTFRNMARSVSVAQTLAPSCEVLETEAIVRTPSGHLQFLVYDAEGKRVDHAFFPTPRGDSISRPSPQSCLGCHYTFDTRRFNVVIPSYAALNLRGSSPGHPLPPAGSSDPFDACLRPGETIVRDLP